MATIDLPAAAAARRGGASAPRRLPGAAADGAGRARRLSRLHAAGRCGCPSPARSCCRCCDCVGLQQYARLFANERFMRLGREHRHLRRALPRRAAWSSASCSPCSSTSASAARACSARSSSIPTRCRFVVTGLAWQWFLNPELGLQKLVRDLGFAGFTFDWIVNQRHGDLHARHRRPVAGLRAGDGDPAGRACAASTPTCGRPRASTASRPGGSISRSCCRCWGRWSSRPSCCSRCRWSGSTTSSSP